MSILYKFDFTFTKMRDNLYTIELKNIRINLIFCFYFITLIKEYTMTKSKRTFYIVENCKRHQCKLSDFLQYFETEQIEQFGF